MNTYYCSLASLAGLLAASALSPATAATVNPIVHIAHFQFNPRTITVASGETVTFVNDDNEPHTATAVDKSFDSEGLDTHGTWHHRFSRAGSFAYYCEMHPYMKGTVVVTAPPAGVK